LKQTVRR